jgi:MFS family permease
MGTFIFIWCGQVLSLVGSSLTNFALSIWLYQRSNSTTQFALLILSTTLPAILVSPVAGVFVDRWSRRWTMILSDFCAGLCTLCIAGLFVTGKLEVWNLCLLTALSSSFSTFQGLAYSAATTLMVPKEQLGRASGMVQSGTAVAGIISPLLATALLATIQLQGIILLDFATLCFALLCLLLVQFTEVKTEKAQEEKVGSILEDAVFGWNYFMERPGLVGLLVFIASGNFLVGLAEALTAPLVLSFASLTALATISSIDSIGMLLGSLAMSFWGGLQRQMATVFISMLLIGVSCLVSGLRASAVLFSISDFCLFFLIPIINGSIQVIYQKKVAPEVQGRVFSFRRTIAQSSLPLAYLAAGPLADRVFEPLMASGGSLADSIGQIIGFGRGRGMALIFVIAGIFTVLLTCIAYLYAPLRQVEDDLPDTIPDAPALDTSLKSPESASISPL